MTYAIQLFDRGLGSDYSWEGGISGYEHSVNGYDRDFGAGGCGWFGCRQIGMQPNLFDVFRRLFECGGNRLSESVLIADTSDQPLLQGKFRSISLIIF